MGDNQTGLDALSQRQKEVLRRVGRGLQAKEIALELDITERTVKAHTDAARRKLGVATSREAARLLEASESKSPLGREGQWPSRPIDNNSDDTAPSQDDPIDAPNPEPRPSGRSSGLLDRPGSRLAADDGTDGDVPDRRDDPGDARPDAELDPGTGGLRHAGGDGAAGGWLGGLKRRLSRLSLLQWLGLIVLVAFVMALIVAGLFSALLTLLELIQQWHHNGHGMVAP